MSKFVAECPVKKCSFRKESFRRNVAKGEVILHVYRTDGENHGPKGSTPEHELKIEIRRIGRK